MATMEYVPGKSKIFCDQGLSKLWPITSMWTDKDVHDFLCDIGYGKYAKCFLNNAINGKQLIAITPFQLQRIGVTNMQDALHLHATFQATTHRMWYNSEDPHKPPNMSYSSTTKGHITQNPNLPQNLQPQYSSAFHPTMPPLPGHPYEIDWKQLCLPYRQHGDRSHVSWYPPRRAIRYHVSTIDGNADDWKFYSSHM